MKLKRVQIKNFRSIGSLDLNLNPRCQVLVGLNESGKSNILKALRLLADEFTPEPDDRRDPLVDEELIEESYVRFVFEYNKDEREKTYDSISALVLKTNESRPFVENKGTSYDLRQFCNTLVEGLYVVNTVSGAKAASRWALPATLAVCGGWKAVSGACPPNFQVQGSLEHPVPLSKYKVVAVEDFPDIPADYLTELTVKDVTALTSSPMREAVMSNLPTCIFWEYTDANLLPGKIDIAAFTRDPSSVAPLKAMFNLAGIEDIPSTITAEKQRPNGMRNLLNRVATKTTKHLHSIWRDYRDVRVFLAENGPHIDAGVQDKANVYNFDRRSDGFKRFITFLLMISANERTKQLRDTLILIDEPEICLHPSGAKHLRQELIKISDSNLVLYSTHSIFMVDRENTSRHLIVTKRNEVTEVKTADNSNILDEEVIYNALGYSVFEGLKGSNIVFEGWRDKQLFRSAIKATSKKTLSRAFESYGTCHAQGVKDIPRIASILELANRHFFIISDDDQVAVQYQKQYKGEGQWLRYSDVLGGGPMTSEDFVKSAVLDAALADILSGVTPPKNVPVPSLNGAFGRLCSLRRWLASCEFSKDEQDNIVNDLKDAIFSQIEPSQIEERYFDMLQALQKMPAVRVCRAAGGASRCSPC